MVMRSRDSRGTAMFDGVWRVPFTVTPFLPSTCSSQVPACIPLNQRHGYVRIAMCCPLPTTNEQSGAYSAQNCTLSLRGCVRSCGSHLHCSFLDSMTAFVLGTLVLLARCVGNRVPSSTSIGVLLRRPSVIS